MRALLLVVLVLLTSSAADARGKRTKRVAAETEQVERREKPVKPAAKPEAKKKPNRGQSIGAPWSGKLKSMTQTIPTLAAWSPVRCG